VTHSGSNHYWDHPSDDPGDDPTVTMIISGSSSAQAALLTTVAY
jgi:hypothetical protein